MVWWFVGLVVRWFDCLVVRWFGGLLVWICYNGDTLGQGDFDLKYGADVIFKGLECTTATIDAYDYTHDIQPVVDKRWCSPQSEIQLICTTAPGVTVSVIMGIVERMK